MNDLRNNAAAIIGSDKLQMLEAAGITIIHKSIMEDLMNCQHENILMLPSCRPILVAPATAADIERVNRGYVVMD